MTISGKPAEREFSDNLGSIMVFDISTSQVRVEVAITNYKTIYSQLLSPYDDGVMRYLEFNLSELVEPYSKEYTSFPLRITITDGPVTETIETWVFHHEGDIEKTFMEWCGNFFLSNATTKRTTPQRKESLYLPYGGSTLRLADASLTVYYDDDSSVTYQLTINTDATIQNMRYLTFCANDYALEGKSIYRMVAMAVTEVLDGNQVVQDTRYATMEYLIDFEHIAEEGPVFIYQNAWGVPEKFYATGNTEFTPDIQRDSAVINGVYKNYRQQLTKQWKVDTGILSPEEAACLLEMFYSPHIMQCSINQYGEYAPWKEVAIVKSDIKHTNDDDTLIRYSFTYRNAEKRVSAQSEKEYPYIFTTEHTVMFE